MTQGGSNGKNIPANLLQNTDNIIKLPTLMHEEVSAEYQKLVQDASAKNPDGSTMNMYQWLQTQPFEVQREEELEILAISFFSNKMHAADRGPSMEVDKTLAELGARLDAWFDESAAPFGSDDPAAQTKALLRGVAIEKDIRRLTAESIATLTALLNRQDGNNEQQRVAELVRGFEFGSKLAHALHDELLDTDNEAKVVHLIQDMAEVLDRLNSGPDALAALLDHTDVGVRVSAAASLVNSMPDLAVPVLREVDRKEGGTSADFTAHWALLIWETKQKAKAKEADDKSLP